MKVLTQLVKLRIDALTLIGWLVGFARRGVIVCFNFASVDNAGNWLSCDIVMTNSAH